MQATEIALHAIPDLLPFGAATDEIEGVLGYLELLPHPAADPRRAADDIAARAVAAPAALPPRAAARARPTGTRLSDSSSAKPVFGQGRARGSPAGFDVAAQPTG